MGKLLFNHAKTFKKQLCALCQTYDHSKIVQLAFLAYISMYATIQWILAQPLSSPGIPLSNTCKLDVKIDANILIICIAC
jgi:hypothetical protein